jgi:hypothetical protein
MRCLVVVCVLCGLVLSAATLVLPRRGSRPSLVTCSLRAQGSRTEQMQQSAYKKKMDRAKQERAKQERAADNQLAATVVPTPTHGDYDYLALVILGASLLVLALVAVRRRSIRLRF